MEEKAIFAILLTTALYTDRMFVKSTSVLRKAKCASLLEEDPALAVMAVTLMTSGNVVSRV